jgi:hypothetical protein
MSISGFFQFIIGFIIGVLLLAGSGAAAAYFFLSSLSENPPKPVFSEEQPEPEASTTTVEDSQEENSETPEATESESASESSAATTETLEAGAYKARVTWPQGLSIRSEPDLEATRIGGVAYNQEVVVLGESDDQEWQNVRVPRNGKEGWVKAGNLDKVSE